MLSALCQLPTISFWVPLTLLFLGLYLYLKLILNLALTGMYTRTSFFKTENAQVSTSKMAIAVNRKF